MDLNNFVSAKMIQRAKALQIPMEPPRKPSQPTWCVAFECRYAAKLLSAPHVRVRWRSSNNAPFWSLGCKPRAGLVIWWMSGQRGRQIENVVILLGDHANLRYEMGQSVRFQREQPFGALQRAPLALRNLLPLPESEVNPRGRTALGIFCGVLPWDPWNHCEG